LDVTGARTRLDRQESTHISPSKRQLTADSVEKVGFSDRLNPGTTTTGEPTHHIEWFFGPSLTFAALLLG
jgi:hypothetical protein